MNQRLMRVLAFRSYIGTGALRGATLAIALLLLLTGRIDVAAQDASPAASASRLAALGYPEVRLVATDAGFEAPSEVAAGRSLVVLENRGTPGGPAQISDVNFIQFPPGITLDDFNNAFATPEAGPPDWFGEIVSTGGFYVEAGQTGYAVLDLQPGEWYVGVGDANPFVPLTVTGGGTATPAVGIDPTADVTVAVSEFTIDLSGSIPAGRRVWHVTNAGEQSHELTLVKTPELLTVEQVQTIIGLPEGSALPPGVPDPATFEFLATGPKTMSAGREIWIEVDLAPGHYVAFCSQPDAATGQPHALLGEVAVFTVGEPGTPVA